MNNQPTAGKLTLIKALLFVLALAPLLQAAIVTVNHDFGPNFIEFIQRWTGTWTLTLLLLTLCISPLRAMTQWHTLLRLRRTLGLFTFFYALLHLLTFIGLSHHFNPTEISRAILKYPFVTLGFAAFLIMLPLAATSNQFAIRRLGGRRWQELHRNIYLIAILGCLHYLWLAKTTALLWPIGYSAALTLLLAWRIQERRRKAIPVPQTQSSKPLIFFKQKPD